MVQADRLLDDEELIDRVYFAQGERHDHSATGRSQTRSVAEHPHASMGLVLLGIAVYAGIGLLFAGLDGVAGFIAAYSGNHLEVDSIGWKIWFAPPVLVSSLLIGRMLARWAPGRELAACVVYAVLVSIYSLVPALGNNGALTAVFCVLLVSAGAAWEPRCDAAKPDACGECAGNRGAVAAV